MSGTLATYQTNLSTYLGNVGAAFGSDENPSTTGTGTVPVNPNVPDTGPGYNLTQAAFAATGIPEAITSGSQYIGQSLTAAVNSVEQTFVNTVGAVAEQELGSARNILLRGAFFLVGFMLVIVGLFFALDETSKEAVLKLASSGDSAEAAEL